MLSEEITIKARPFEKVLLLVVVGDERNSLSGFSWWC